MGNTFLYKNHCCTHSQWLSQSSKHIISLTLDNAWFFPPTSHSNSPKQYGHLQYLYSSYALSQSGHICIFITLTTISCPLCNHIRDTYIHHHPLAPLDYHIRHNTYTLHHQHNIHLLYYLRQVHPSICQNQIPGFTEAWIILPEQSRFALLRKH